MNAKWNVWRKSDSSAITNIRLIDLPGRPKKIAGPTTESPTTQWPWTVRRQSTSSTAVLSKFNGIQQCIANTVAQVHAIRTEPTSIIAIQQCGRADVGGSQWSSHGFTFNTKQSASNAKAFTCATVGPATPQCSHYCQSIVSGARCRSSMAPFLLLDWPFGRASNKQLWPRSSGN